MLQWTQKKLKCTTAVFALLEVPSSSHRQHCLHCRHQHGQQHVPELQLLTLLWVFRRVRRPTARRLSSASPPLWIATTGKWLRWLPCKTASSSCPRRCTTWKRFPSTRILFYLFSAYVQAFAFLCVCACTHTWECMYVFSMNTYTHTYSCIWTTHIHVHIHIHKNAHTHTCTWTHTHTPEIE